jgi:Putative porin
MTNKRTSGPAGPAAIVCAALVAAMCAPAADAASDPQQQQSFEVLQGTVINLLQALVQRGVITQQQAEQMVKQAQDKANVDYTAAQAKARAQKQQEEKEGAIAVPYVPKIVQQQIEKQVATQVQPTVTANVIKAARDQGWGVPGALPDWIRSVRITGDLTLRGQDNLYGAGNSAACPAGTPYGNCTILNYAAINAAGGFTQAGESAYLNVTQDNAVMQARARLGADIALSSSWDAGIRIASGALNPNSETQTFSNEFGRYTVGFDRIYIRWRGLTARDFNYLSVVGGKFDNPFYEPTTLVYSKYVAFDGLAVNGKLGIGDGSAQQSFLFMNLGGFPIQEVPLVFQNSKWLVGGQLGASLRFGADQRFTLAGAYYNFDHVQARMNSFDSVLDDYSEPLYATFGNSYCDIENDSTGANPVFGLCSQFRIAEVAAGYVLPLDQYALSLNAEGVRNVGFNGKQIYDLFGFRTDTRRNGYQAELAFGNPDVFDRWDWRGTLGYRYVQGDALLDALTDSDFHEGGTNAEGYFMRADFGLAHNVWTRFSYYAGNQIDGPRYQVDVLQLDLNARF